MMSEVSYQNVQDSYVPNSKRGHWSNPSDFIYSGIALAFRMNFLHMSWFYTLEEYADHDIITTYFISLVLYIIPLMVLHSFLGQFSSSSYISAFRLTPIFKCLGFISLGINLCTIMYFSIFAVVPLAYMFASMQPTLPWSCEGFKKWPYNFTYDTGVNLCDVKNATFEQLNGPFTLERIPSVLYFRSLFNDSNLFRMIDDNLAISGQLTLCSILFWCLVALIIYKFFETAKIGLLIRYSVWIFVSLLIICLIRFSLLPGAGKIYRKFFIPTWDHYIKDSLCISVYGLAAFGPGWGLLITLSSFNKFNNNIKKTSWIIGVMQMCVIIALQVLSKLIQQYFEEESEGHLSPNFQLFPMTYLFSGSVMASMEWPNFWCILFFFMLFLGALVLTIIQLFSITTTIFDEFSSTRNHKTKFGLMMTIFMALCSQFFITNKGVWLHRIIDTEVSFIQNAFNFLLIIVVLWIYGVPLFQRDFEFMIKKCYSKFQIYIWKFGIPLFIVPALFLFMLQISMEHNALTIPVIYFIFGSILVLPLIFIPLYTIYSLNKGSGTFKERVNRSFRPNDWYPVNGEDLRHYEEATTSAMLMGNV